MVEISYPYNIETLVTKVLVVSKCEMITELLAAVFVLTTRFQYSNYLNIFCLIYAFSGYVVNILLNVRNSIGYEVTYTHYDQ